MPSHGVHGPTQPLLVKGAARWAYTISFTLEWYQCLLVARRHARATGREKPGDEHARLRGPAECLAHCASQHVKVSPSLKTFRNVHFAPLAQSLTSLQSQVLKSRISVRRTTVQLRESRVRSANHLVSKGCRCHREQSVLKVHLFQVSPRHVPDAFQG